jgi:hypothetical protein
VPKIQPIYLRVNDPAGGTPYQAKCEVLVTTDGVFSIKPPEDLVPIIEDLLKNTGAGYPMTMALNFKHGLKIQCRDLGHGKKLLEDAARAQMATEIKSELVICYTSSHDVAYWKKGDGEIVPNGGYDREGYNNHTGKWCGTNNATTRTETFSVGLAARVYEKKTLTRSTGTEVIYKLTYGGGDHFATETWLQKLNSFVGLTMPDVKEMQQMPYTEEAAEFFYKALMHMCMLSDRIENFFGSPEMIQRAIESRSGLLLGSPA